MSQHEAAVNAPRVRTARLEDAAALAGLARELGYDVDAGDAAARLSRLTASPQDAVLVAEVGGGRIAGFLHVRESGGLLAAPKAELAALVVAETARGRGFGGILLGAAETWAEARGLAAMRVRSNVVRDAAHRFYRARGYGEVKRSCVFEKRLASGPGAA
jgi:GNAT superfamily N-acetyltransferase